MSRLGLRLTEPQRRLLQEIVNGRHSTPTGNRRRTLATLELLGLVEWARVDSTGYGWFPTDLGNTTAAAQ